MVLFINLFAINQRQMNLKNKVFSESSSRQPVTTCFVWLIDFGIFKNFQDLMLNKQKWEWQPRWVKQKNSK